MRISISANEVDPDNKLFRFDLKIENEYFKGTLEFYEPSETFKLFAEQLQDFPFGSLQDIDYTIEGLFLRVSLADKAGRIKFEVSINDLDGNKLTFTDYSVEASALQRLSSLLMGADFASRQEIEWSSRSSQI